MLRQMRPKIQPDYTDCNEKIFRPHGMPLCSLFMEAPDTYSRVLGLIVHIADGIGVAVLVAGLFLAVILALRVWKNTGDGEKAYTVLRRTLGGGILAGLEVLVAGDLIRTVAVEPTFDNVVTLGIIVLIRTFLSFSLEIEIEGTLPWKRALTQTGASVIADAVRKSQRIGGQLPE